MSWRNTGCIYEGIEHIIDAFKDNLPCKGHIWNTEGNKDFIRIVINVLYIMKINGQKKKILVI